MRNCVYYGVLYIVSERWVRTFLDHLPALSNDVGYACASRCDHYLKVFNYAVRTTYSVVIVIGCQASWIKIHATSHVTFKQPNVTKEISACSCSPNIDKHFVKP